MKLALLWIVRALGGFAAARWLTRDAVMIVGWHGVSTEREHERFPSLFIAPESLRQRLAFLAKHYRVVSLDDVVSQHAAGRFTPRQVVLTFDDGMENFRDVAVPILRELGMTATNYIVSEYLETGAPNYRMVVRDLVRRQAPGAQPATLPRGTAVPPNATVETVEDLALREFDSLEPGLEPRAAYATELGTLVGIDVAQVERERTWHAMTSDALRSLAESGFDMELHTHSHVNVVDHPDRAQVEVRTCRAAVERATGRPATHFCYPSGRWTRAAWSVLEDAGVRTATTTLAGPNFPESPLLALRRVMNGEDRGQLEFEFKMSNVPWLLARLAGRAHRSMPSEKRLAYRVTRSSY